MCQNYWPKRTLRHLMQKKSVRCNMAAVWMATAGLITCINSLGKIMQTLIRFYCLLLFWVSTYISPKSRSLTIQQYVCLQCKNPSILDIISALHSNGSFFAGQPCHDTLHSFIVGYYSSIFRINPGLGYSLGLLEPKGFPKSAIQASFSI